MRFCVYAAQRSPNTWTLHTIRKLYIQDPIKKMFVPTFRGTNWDSYLYISTFFNTFVGMDWPRSIWRSTSLDDRSCDPSRTQEVSLTQFASWFYREDVRENVIPQSKSMGLTYIPTLGWFGGQCRHIFHTWMVWVLWRFGEWTFRWKIGERWWQKPIVEFVV